ncbi:hypothetical protein CCACVL1_30857 [Corchorus capsularis]|uniref:Uncharacterized protein n=1 Tax=Corchorus capsularis TaxID=210143 RepID=A0A1R3FV10_COCAP|nr:hypothetical protein CCACVL1_30857 [Corchorus capsularis]
MMWRGEGAWFSLIGKFLSKKQPSVEGMRMGLGLALKLVAAVTVARGGGSRRGGGQLSRAQSVTGVGGILGLAGKAVSKSKELVSEGGGVNQGSYAEGEVNHCKERVNFSILRICMLLKILMGRLLVGLLGLLEGSSESPQAESLGHNLFNFTLSIDLLDLASISRISSL